MPSEHDSLVPRVVALETTMTSVASAVVRIEAKVTARERPNYGVLIGVCGLVLGAGGSLWALAIRPIQGQADANAASIDRNATAIDRVADAQTRMAGLLEEAESQFGHVADVLNLETQMNERLLAIVWTKAGMDLPPRDYWPLGNLLRRRKDAE